MNRHDRRKAQKLSRDATPAEIFPDDKHRPIPSQTQLLMTELMKTMQQIFPDHEMTLFVAERVPSESRDLPRFNYISTADRRDMLAVLKAFIAKNEPIGAELDKINDAPPTDTKQ